MYVYLPEEGTRNPGAGVTGSCELPKVGAGHWPRSSVRASGHLGCSCASLASPFSVHVPRHPLQLRSRVSGVSSLLLVWVLNSGRQTCQQAPLPTELSCPPCSLLRVARLISGQRERFHCFESVIMHENLIFQHLWINYITHLLIFAILRGNYGSWSNLSVHLAPESMNTFSYLNFVCMGSGL